MDTKHRVTINLNNEDYSALMQLSKAVDRPLAYLGRLAVRRLVSDELDLQGASPRPKSPVQNSAGK